MARLIRVSDPDFVIGQGDTGPDLDVYLEDAVGARPALTGAAITFRMRRRGSSSVLVAGTADAHADQVTEKGRCAYTWASDDTAVAGPYEADFEVVWAGGERITFPNEVPFIVEVVETVRGA
ncbi:MAG: hypothetical protein AB7G37_03455 [Solirubrobacteraceae bacterium]